MRSQMGDRDQGSKDPAGSGLRETLKELRALRKKREILVTNALAASGRVDPVMTRRTPCGPHGHRPTPSSIGQWAPAFRNKRESNSQEPTANSQ